MADSFRSTSMKRSRRWSKLTNVLYRYRTRERVFSKVGYISDLGLGLAWVRSVAALLSSARI
jgi:hypothetical protein